MSGHAGKRLGCMPASGSRWTFGNRSSSCGVGPVVGRLGMVTMIVVMLAAPHGQATPPPLSQEGAVRAATPAKGPQGNAPGDRSRGARAKPRARSEDSGVRAKAFAERERVGLALVRQHEPSLMDLLVKLRRERPREYRRAVNDLWRTARRLERVREREPERYEAEIKAWRASTQVQLCLARFVMHETEQARRELEEAVRREYDARLRLLKMDRDRLRKRYERLERTIATLESQRKRKINHTMRRLVTKAKEAYARDRAERGRKRKTSRGRAPQASTPGKKRT